MGDKLRERMLLDEFLFDSGLAREGWAFASEGERPDFTCRGPGSAIVGIEVTEVLERDTGRLRAGEAHLAGTIKETIADFLPTVGARGAVVDGYVDQLPRRRSDADELARNLCDHLNRHRLALAHDRGTVATAFRFPWGLISRITRVDNLGGVFLCADEGDDPHSAAEDRTVVQIEEAVETAVLRKIGLASGYVRTTPLWLVLRNPYRHVGKLSVDLRDRLSQRNGRLFDRVYLYNRKLNTADASPPRPVVIRLL